MFPLAQTGLRLQDYLCAGLPSPWGVVGEGFHRGQVLQGQVALGAVLSAAAQMFHDVTQFEHFFGLYSWTSSKGPAFTDCYHSVGRLHKWGKQQKRGKQWKSEKARVASLCPVACPWCKQRQGEFQRLCNMVAGQKGESYYGSPFIDS